MLQPGTHRTLRRDVLRRLVEAGRVVLTESYHYDDMTGESRTYTEMPVALTKHGPDEWKNRREGVCYLFPHALEDGVSAWTWVDEKGETRVHLHVHSNSNYDFRILPK